VRRSLGVRVSLAVAWFAVCGCYSIWWGFEHQTWFWCFAGLAVLVAATGILLRWNWILSVFAPAGAILAGVLLQQLLISAWPGAQTHSILNVSLDTYFGALALAAASLLVGLIIRGSGRARWMYPASFLFPGIWLLLIQFAVFPVGSGLSALRIIYMAIALAPTFGLGLAYSLPSNNRSSAP
jgi:hypothetical protein